MAHCNARLRVAVLILAVPLASAGLLESVKGSVFRMDDGFAAESAMIINLTMRF